mgnify:CR=1 FL=1
MIYAIAGFLLGFLIPYIARRFAKFMPATFAYALWQIVFSGKCGCKKGKKSPRYAQLCRGYFWRSLMAGLLTCGLFYTAFVYWGAEGCVFRCAFIWILLLLAEIDYRMYLLPDILTIPLLLLGLLSGVFDAGYVILQDAVVAANVGYFLPVAASLLFVKKNKDAFGGGDVKLLAALGAWLGLEGMLAAIVVSCGLFFVWAVIKRQRSGAYGPALAIAGIIVAFWYF